MQEEIIVMSAKERERLRLVEAVLEKRILQRDVALRVGLSSRQMKRLVVSYRLAGACGLVSRRRGAPSNHRISNEQKQAIMQRIKERYADFGPTLAAECLNNEGMSVSRETLRHWMCDAVIWQQAGHKKPKRRHPPRARRAGGGADSD